MSTHKLKSVVQRGTMFGAAFALVAAVFAPLAPSAFADALNPLTERSLTLSSGSPGWNYKDASGNATYAPPNSGANGKQTANTFSFRVSSATPLKAMTFQYCTTPAGNCMGPGDIEFAGTSGSFTRPTNASQEANKKSDLEIVLDAATKAEISSTTYTNKFNATTGQPNVVASNGYDPDTVHPNMPKLDGTEGNFIVLYKANLGDPWSYSSDWTMDASVNQTTGGNGTAGTVANGTSTGKNNFIKISKSTGDQPLGVGNYVKVIFFATNTTYITNPGSKEFFVKINTYNHATTEDATTLVDGGVTVANVMNRSIEIQTKVLETMQFSVGTVDPNTLDSTGGVGSQFELATSQPTHSPCDPIVQGMTAGTTTPNVLQLGDADGEFSLRTDTTYSTHSYWRLSSNSSGGATVYYSGVTLSNTVGDQIKAIGKTKQAPTKGGEQFGLALDNGVNGAQYEVSYAKERDSGALFQNGADNDVAGLHEASLIDDGIAPDESDVDPENWTTGNLSWHTPRLAPLAPLTDYSEGTGTVNVKIKTTSPDVYYYGNTINTKFAFDPDSNVIPTPIARGTQVLDCVTGKMRYIANIAATTPAGIYTTKINYIAAPQY